MIRKLALAVAFVAVGFVVAAPVQAGGSGAGAKKTATIRVKNSSTAAVVSAPFAENADPVASAFKQVPVAGIGNFPVAPGKGYVLAAWAAAAAVGGLEAPVGGANFNAKANQKGYATVTGTYDNETLPLDNDPPSIGFIGGGPF